MAVSTSLIVNGVARTISLLPRTSLLSVLRDGIGLTGAKPGCGQGACGACTVLLDGVPVRSCMTSVGEVVGRSITTVEGLAEADRLHPVQRAFVECGAMQCGYCTPGMIVGAVALLANNPDPDEPLVRAAMDGHICRCCTYPRILRAVRRAAELLRQGDDGPQAEERQGPPHPLDPQDVSPRPDGPWDLLPPERRDYFEVLGEGLVAVLPAGADRQAPGAPDGGAWVHIGADGLVTAFTGKMDVGQGTDTALALLVAEELRVPVTGVRVVMGDTDVCPFDIGTFGSRSMPEAGELLRTTAAAARAVLIALAAARWGREPASLVAVDGHVRSRAGEQTIPYGDLVRGLRRLEVVPARAPVTDRAAWHTAGSATPATGLRQMVTGAKRFPTDLARAGMLWGRVLHAPAVGATLGSVNADAARAIPGVTVVHDGDFVGVAAPDRTTADRALQAIHAEWARQPQPSEQGLAEYLRGHPVEVKAWGGGFHHEAGDVERALAAAPTRLSATYTAAYIAHVPLETRAALAEWAGGRLTVWTGTQRPFGVRGELAAALGLPEARIRVVVPGTGAGFGGRHTGRAAIEAARLAHAAGRPVKVTWTREEEFTCGYLRPAAVIDIESGTAPDGTMTAWAFRNINSGTAGIHCPYAIDNQRLDYQPAASPLPQGSYRALAATANAFARESHIDEVAKHCGADPLEFRLRHIRDDRLATVLRAAAERAGWGTRSREAGYGTGVACGTEKGGRVATCASVRVHADGRLELLRIVTAFECGAIVHPDGLVNQVEGATIMGLGGALCEAIHFEDGRILNPSLAQYRLPRFSDIPPVEVVLVDRRDIPSTGAGEAPIIAVAPALANAIFAATGRRLRSLPLVPDGFVH